MTGQARILNDLNLITVEMGILQSSIQELKDNATAIMVQGDQLANIMDEVGIDSRNSMKSEEDEANINPELFLKTEDDEKIGTEFFENPDINPHVFD